MRSTPSRSASVARRSVRESAHASAALSAPESTRIDHTSADDVRSARSNVALAASTRACSVRIAAGSSVPNSRCASGSARVTATTSAPGWSTPCRS